MTYSLFSQLCTLKLNSDMEKYIDLLKELISTPSFSKEEKEAAAVMRKFLQNQNIPFKIRENNTWAYNKYFAEGKSVILLNSHIDTVLPAKGYSRNPFSPDEVGDRLYGLGSNDAGGPLVALLAAFVHFFERKDLPFNLIYAATAEEEISGSRGLEIVLPEIGHVDFAIVGEPTKMELAAAEKGLLVLDCYAHGKSGHAAREEGENALYKALDDIRILQDYKFEKLSEQLGEVKVTVTQIEAGTQHNVVPDICHFVGDGRTNEHYSSGITPDPPFVQKVRESGIRAFGSPTTSDQAIIPFPSVKMGPGDSARSHTADEYIHKSEIIEGIQLYIDLLEGIHL